MDKEHLKKLMKEEKQKKIDSPLAKYNSTGQLSCIICNQIIKSELFWNAHINNKIHLQQLDVFKNKSQEKSHVS